MINPAKTAAKAGVDAVAGTAAEANAVAKDSTVTEANANSAALATDWDTTAIVRRRDTYYAASQRAFVPFARPLVFQRGRGQYLWDEKG